MSEGKVFQSDASSKIELERIISCDSRRSDIHSRNAITNTYTIEQNEWDHYKFVRKRLSYLRSLLKQDANTNYKYSNKLELIVRAFKSTFEVLDQELNSLIEKPSFQLNEAIQRFNEIQTSIVDRLEEVSTSAGAHVYLTLFVGQVNMQKIKRESVKWQTVKANSFGSIADAAVNIFQECMRCIRIEVEWAVKLHHELENWSWCSRKLLKRKKYARDVEFNSYRESIHIKTNLLIDNLLSLLLNNQETDLMGTRNLELNQPVAYAGDTNFRNRIGGNFNECLRGLLSCEYDCKDDATLARISTSLVRLLAGKWQEIEHQVERLTRDSERRVHGDDLMIIKAYQSVLSCFMELYRKSKGDKLSFTVTCDERAEEREESAESDKCLIKLANELNELIRNTSADRLYEKMSSEWERFLQDRSSWMNVLENPQRLQMYLATKFARPKCNLFMKWNGIDILLFDWERDAISNLIDDGEDFLKRVDCIAYPFYNMGFHQMCEIFERPECRSSKRNSDLETCIKHVSRTASRFEDLKVGNFQMLALMLYPILYVADVVSDAFVARNHFINGDRMYFLLTVLFILGPLLVEITSKVAWKLFGMDSQLQWKDFFIFENLKILPRHIPNICPRQTCLLRKISIFYPYLRSMKSILYAIKSRNDYDKDLKKFYAELQYLRYKQTIKCPRQPKWISNPDLMQAISYSRMINNEISLFDWKMMECLNESAPQLLLQLMIAGRDIINKNEIGKSAWIGIFTSLASLSWSMHLSHYNMHFDGLQNNFGDAKRILDFLFHFLMLCSRFVTISFTAALNPQLFLLSSFLYLTGLFIYLVVFSTWKNVYRHLLKNKRLLFWPVHRLFTTPYVLRLWRIDSVDDILFHMETIILASRWPYDVTSTGSIGLIRWIIPGVILCIHLLCLPILLWANNRVHISSRNCKSGKWNLDLFWNESSDRRLKQGLPRISRGISTMNSL